MLQRSAFSLARRAAVIRPVAARRTFVTTQIRREEQPTTPVTGRHDPRINKLDVEEEQPKTKVTGLHDPRIKKLDEIKTEEDLIGPGAPPGTVPTDLEQATGLERLELLGKMQGIDIFDMRPLDASRLGTLDNPIIVRSVGTSQIVGCTGYPADSHTTRWFTLDRERPIDRCDECGNAIRMEYIGPLDAPDEYADGTPRKPENFSDYLRLEYMPKEWQYFDKKPSAGKFGGGKPV
jgi:cytochrome c oxidase subunit 5b